jgi:hypothetical protein
VLWNEGSEELHVLNEFAPALNIEGFLEAFLGLAADGKVSREGIPHRHSYRDEIALPFVPRGVQRAALAAVAALSRIFDRRDGPAGG